MQYITITYKINFNIRIVTRFYFIVAPIVCEMSALSCLKASLPNVVSNELVVGWTLILVWTTKLLSLSPTPTY